MWKQLECSLYKREKYFDFFWIWDDGPWAGERGCEGGEGSRLMGQMCGERIVSGF
jgi:hypothetical protein